MTDIVRAGFIDPGHFKNLGLYPTWTGHLYADATYQCKPRILGDYQMLFLEAGRGRLTEKEHSFELGEKDVFFLFPNILHSYNTDKNHLMNQWWIGFNGYSSHHILTALGVSPENPLIKGVSNPEFLRLSSELVNFEGPASYSSTLKMSGMLHILFGMLAEEVRSKASAHEPASSELYSKEIQYAISFMESNFPYNINVDTIVTASAYTRTYFSTKFKTETGRTPSEYLTSIRLKHAMRLLEDTEYSISQIAASVGIPDSRYFSRVFMKNLHSSPTSYRSEVKKRDTI